MKSKALLHRFGKTNIFFATGVVLYTERVKEPEKSALISDRFNFEELTLEIETKQPMGIFRKKNFFLN